MICACSSEGAKWQLEPGSWSRKAYQRLGRVLPLSSWGVLWLFAGSMVCDGGGSMSHCLCMPADNERNLDGVRHVGATRDSKNIKLAWSRNLSQDPDSESSSRIMRPASFLPYVHDDCWISLFLLS